MSKVKCFIRCGEGKIVVYISGNPWVLTYNQGKGYNRPIISHAMFMQHNLTWFFGCNLQDVALGG